MIKVILAFLILLLSVWIGIQLSHDPGYVLISLNHWTIETTLWFGLFSLFLLFFFFHILLLLCRKINALPEGLSKLRARRRSQKAQARTNKGLIEFSEGHWAAAKNSLIKALPDSDSPLLNYLTAARAAQEMGENNLRDDYLREAQQSVPDARIAVELTQAQLQLANQQWEQALATLRHLQDLAPHHPYVLKLLMCLYQEVRDWPQLISLLPELKKYKVIQEREFITLRQHAYMQNMLDLVRIKQGDALQKVVKSLPRPLDNDPVLMVIYCQYLLQNHEAEQAESIMRHCLRKEFNEPMISLYGKHWINDHQLSFAESLLKKHADSAALLLCLGQLCTAKQLWGKAKTYLEQSVELTPTRTAYVELGKLYEQFGEQIQATQAYRKGLELTDEV